MLDRGTNPPDPYLDPRGGTAAIVVVQNVYPFEREPAMNEHVAVRVIGNSARVIADALPPEVAPRLAGGPMPLPLAGSAVAYASPAPEGQVELFPVMVYNRYHPNWTVPVAGQ
jgi:hypothetical protein